MPELDFTGLRAQLEAQAQPPSFDEIRDRRRRRTRRILTAAATVTVLIVLTGTGLAVAATRRTDRTPPVGPTVGPSTPASPAACTAASLSRTASSLSGGAAGAQQSAILTVTNAGTRPCSLTGAPDLATLDPAGGRHVIPANVAVGPGAPETVNLAPNQDAHADVVTSMACADSSRPVTYRNVAVDLGDGAVIPVTGLALTTTCVVTVGPWSTQPSSGSMTLTLRQTPPASTASPAPTRAATTPCQPTDIASGPVTHNGAAGTLIHWIELRNTGPRRCTLTAQPVVLFTPAGGAPTTLPINQGTIVPPDPSTQESPATIDPGEHAILLLTTSLSCLGGQDTTTYDGIVLELGERLIPVPGLTLETTCPPAVDPPYRQLP